jgi:hypothetical protein
MKHKIDLGARNCLSTTRAKLAPQLKAHGHSPFVLHQITMIAKPDYRSREIANPLSLVPGALVLSSICVDTGTVDPLTAKFGDPNSATKVLPRYNHITRIDERTSRRRCATTTLRS